MLPDLTEDEVYKYLGFAFVILIVAFVIYKIIETQSKVVEGMENKDKKSVTEVLEEVQKLATIKKNELHLKDNKDKLDDIIIAYKTIIGADVLKSMSTDARRAKNPIEITPALLLYNHAMEALDKLVDQLDRFDANEGSDGGSSGGGGFWG